MRYEGHFLSVCQPAFFSLSQQHGEFHQGTKREKKQKKKTTKNKPNSLTSAKTVQALWASVKFFKNVDIVKARGLKTTMQRWGPIFYLAEAA